MKSAVLRRLRHLMGAAATAEKARLAGVLAQIDACRGHAAELRRQIGASLPRSGGPGGPRAADLAAAARWHVHLGEIARAEDDRAAALLAQAEAIRQRLARTSGREAAVAAMAEKARNEERRLAERRAEGLEIRPQRPPDQSSPSRSGASTGSPGMA